MGFITSKHELENAEYEAKGNHDVNCGVLQGQSFDGQLTEGI